MNILITGGTSGLGLALVKTLAEDSENYIVFTLCKNSVKAKELEGTYKNTKAEYVDFTDPKSVDDFVSSIEMEKIDVLINNAYSGNPQGTHFHKTAPSDFEHAFSDNVIPLIKIMQACLAGMRKRKFGKIINIITSSVIDVPPTGFSVYTSTKAYIRQLSKSISKEYGRYNITSNCVLPEYMHTGFGHVEDFQLEQMKSAHPLKELLTPEEVAEIVKFVVSSSQQLNGAEIPVNAGQHIM